MLYLGIGICSALLDFASEFSKMAIHQFTLPLIVYNSSIPPHSCPYLVLSVYILIALAILVGVY